MLVFVTECKVTKPIDNNKIRGAILINNPSANGAENGKIKCKKHLVMSKIFRNFVSRKGRWKKGRIPPEPVGFHVRASGFPTPKQCTFEVENPYVPNRASTHVPPPAYASLQMPNKWFN